MRYWDDMSNQRNFMDELAEKLGITNVDGWYKITATTVQQHGGASLLKQYYDNSLSKCLTSVYPEYQYSNYNTMKGQIVEIHWSICVEVHGSLSDP